MGRLSHVVFGRVAGRAVNWKLDSGGLETLYVEVRYNCTGAW